MEIVEHSSGETKRVTLHEKHAFGGDVSLVTGRPALVSAVARGDTEVFEISPSDLRRIMGERPALGELLLRAFIARRELLVASEFQGLRVLGAGSSRDTFRIRDFLARNQVPFTWIDMDHDPQVGALLHSFGLTEADTPVVVFGSEPLLRNPSTRALAELIGVRRPLAQRVYDLVIVGGGPAGLAAAVYASSEGLATAVIDASAPGGQAGTSSKIENYLGFPTGISGAELANRAILQAQKFGAQFSSPSQAARLEFEKGQTLVWFDREHVSTRCVLIATGAEYRKLDVPKREQFEGLGVYYAATSTELQLCRGAEVIVVGGGNSAGQAVMFLSEETRRVYLLLRGGGLRKSMSSYLADRIEGADNIEVLAEAEICRMLGDQRLEAVEIKNLRTGETRTVQTPAVFTFIGAIPCTNWLPAEIETDSKGFVKTGPTGVSLAVLDCRSGAVLPRNQPSRRLRRRRCPAGLDQARGLCGGGGGDGGAVRSRILEGHVNERRVSPLVSFRQVSARIGQKDILHDLSFDVEAGETLVLLGRSGSGKTTALKMVNGLLLPSAGNVLIEGTSHDCLGLDPLEASNWLRDPGCGPLSAFHGGRQCRTGSALGRLASPAISTLASSIC